MDMPPAPGADDAEEFEDVEEDEFTDDSAEGADVEEDELDDVEVSDLSTDEDDYDDMDFDEDTSTDDDSEHDRRSPPTELSASDANEFKSSEFLVLDTDSVFQHQVRTSVRHPQCCDSLSVSDQCEDIIIASHEKVAVFYDLRSRQILASVHIGFRTYSIAQYGSLFVAGGDHELAAFHVLYEDTGLQVKKVALLSIGGVPLSAMVNGLRFGRCGTEVRLLAANQDKFVYCFDVPSQLSSSPHKSPLSNSESSSCTEPSSSRQLKLDARGFNCRNLRPGGATSSEVCTQPVRILQDGGWLDEEYLTDAIGPFDEPINCAAPSPDGNWIAVVGDSKFVYILDYSHGYSMSRKASVLYKRETKERDKGGCQYVAWSKTSELFAVSSDSHHLVGVWSISKPATRACEESVASSATSDLDPIADIHLVALLGGRGKIKRPCLALQFDPIDDKILYFLERSGRLHAVDTRKGEKSHQKISVKPRLWQICSQSLHDETNRHSLGECSFHGCPGSEFLTSELTGLVVTSSHGVVVGCRDRLLQYAVLRLWTQETHRYFPQKFKDAVIHLLAASICESDGCVPSEHSSNLRSLPREILFNIISLAASPLSVWV